MNCTQNRLFRRFLLVPSLCLPVFGGGIVCGQWEQIHKLRAQEAVWSDDVGWSVSMSGDNIVAGAPCDDEAGHCSGAAYVFDAIRGDQRRRLTADDAAAWDGFGWSIAVSGDIVVVGVISDDDACPDDPFCDSGSAYVFDAMSGEQLHKLTADDAEKLDRFGVSVAVSGTTIVVGSQGGGDNGPGSGSAYVFDAITGEQIRKLTADDGETKDHFGISVAIYGGAVVVGASGDDDACDGDPDCNSGAVYVFDVNTGEQLRKLTADDAVAGVGLGWSIAISGDVVVVGAPGDDDGGVCSGAAYVFDAMSGEQIHKLKADDAAKEDRFGWSVSVGGTVIVVGTYLDIHEGVSSGAAYVFGAITGNQLQKLIANDADDGDFFGYAVGIDQNTITVGAPGVNFEDRGTGAAYVFQIPHEACPADITGPYAQPDGTVDAYDLLVVLAYWGVTGSIADITGPDGVPDGIVDVHDLLALLGGWGPC